MKRLKTWTKKTVGYFEGLISIFVNLLLFGAKLWVGVLFNSIAMIADAWHSLSDSLTSIDEIKNLVLEASDKISDIHHFHFHKYGDHSGLTFHIREVSNMHVKKAHEIANTIEQKIKAVYGFETTIHIEPD